MNRKIFIASCVGAVLVTYLLGVVIFSNRCGFRTYVNGKSVFMNMPDEVVLDVVQSSNNQILTLVRRDGSTEHISVSNLGISLKNQVSSDDFKSNPFLWFTKLFYRTDYHVDMSLDWSDDVLLKNVMKLECMSVEYIKKPVDGYVRLRADGSYEIVKDDSGNEIDKRKLVDALVDAVSKNQFTINLEDAGVYKEDLIWNQKLDVELKQDIQSFENRKMFVNLGFNKTIEIPYEIVLNAVYELDGKAYVHYASMYAYAAHLSRLYNTVGLERKFVTTGGDTLTFTPTKDDTFLGWELNQKETAKNLCKAIANGFDKNNSVDAVWVTKGKSHNGMNDFGDTYVEINIRKQHMWCYVDGKLLFDTDVTTGTDSIASCRTPTGMFMTMDWNTEYTMRGSYGTAFSHYFIRLTPTGIGIHDASWRTKYGGNEYINNGSHGCINTPYDKVKLFYNTLHGQAAEGVPVIIY